MQPSRIARSLPKGSGSAAAFCPQREPGAAAGDWSVPDPGHRFITCTAAVSGVYWSNSAALSLDQSQRFPDLVTSWCWWLLVMQKTAVSG